MGHFRRRRMARALGGERDSGAHLGADPGIRLDRFFRRTLGGEQGLRRRMQWRRRWRTVTREAAKRTRAELFAAAGGRSRGFGLFPAFGTARMSTNLPLVSLLTLLPFVGGIAVLILGRAGRNTARWTALLFAIAAVTITALLWLRFQPAATGMQFDEWRPLEPAIGLVYHVGVDGLSLLMLAVSSIVVLMAIADSWGNEKQGSVYFAFLLFLETGLFGTYTALNFLHWFLYWELSLIPAFFLIRLWGGAGRARAATQFFVYTMVGSIALLISFLAIFLASGSFDFVILTQMAQNGELAAAIAQNLRWQPWDAGHITMALFCGAFLGFAIKTPIVPFHGWLASTYAEASPETTMVLTGALSKMGVYGLLRIMLPIFPEQMWRARTVLLWLAVATIVLPAFTAWVQNDLKRMFAFGS